MINCQEQNSNYEVHVDTNSNVNNLDGTPGKITTLLEEIKNKQLKNGEFLREFLAKLRQSNLVKEKFKNLFSDRQKPESNEDDVKEADIKNRSVEEEETNEPNEAVEENVEQPIEDDYVEDNAESEEVNDEKDSYVYDELANPDAVSIDHYDYTNSKEDENENLNKNNVDEQQDDDKLLNELKYSKSKFPFRIRRSTKGNN